ncbi:MAG: hypothetical protein ACKV2T_40515 [Kofleriaceae bacterium]
MKPSLIAILVLAACGSSQTPGESTTPGSNTEPPAPMKDTRSEFAKRLDAACNALGPTLTTCAVSDANEKLRKGEIKQQEFDEITKPAIIEKLDQEWRDTCYQPTKFTSYQVRVLEVCKQAETECGPLQDCLDNLNKKPPT